MMDRKTYIREVYSKYWIDAREKVYGFSEYDKRLCSLVLERLNGYAPQDTRILEVAVGTGYPFADFFQKAGYNVSGIDLSDTLVAKCGKLYPDVKAIVGDAENMPYLDGSYDTTYCFHSTWYFPDLLRALGEMLRVTRPGGHVLFDIQNGDNSAIDSMYKKRLHGLKGVGRWMRFAKNGIKIVLRKGTPQWRSVVAEVPACPDDILKYLITVDSKDSIGVYGSDALTYVERCDRVLDWPRFQRLVFVLQKKSIC